MRRLLLPGLLLAAGAAGAQGSGINAWLAVLDSDGDGRVSEAEYVRYVMRGFHALDRNGDGVLDASELPRARPGQKPISAAARERAVRATFRRQDLDGNGWLDAAELAEPPH